MIIIKQGIRNEVVLTLKEGENPCNETSTYLLQFINATTKANYFTIARDISTSPDRYQFFCITDTGNTAPDPTSGHVSLPLQGQYHYRAYANPNAVLDPTGLCLVEIGKLLVTGDKEPAVSYQSTVNPQLVAYKNTDINE